MATDTEFAIRLDVDGVEVQQPGSVLLPAARFGSILRESSDEYLNIETDEKSLTVHGDHSKFKLSIANVDEYPPIENFQAEKYHVVRQPLMRELIHRTLFATDTESSRYALGGVFLQFDEAEITAVGTDGRRLAVMKGAARSVEGHHQQDFMTIVPSKAMQFIERALTEGEGDIQLATRNNDIIVKADRATIYSRLIEGRFPKWQDVIPKRDNGVRIQMPVGPFHAAVRQAAIVTNEESRGVDFNIADGTLVMTGFAAEVGDARVEMPVPYTGKPVTISLDHRFVSEVLRVLDAEMNITIDIVDNDNAAVFDTEDGYIYVVMPMSRDARKKASS